MADYNGHSAAVVGLLIIGGLIAIGAYVAGNAVRESSSTLQKTIASAKGKAAMTTIEALNATGVVYAVKDGGY